MSNDPTDAVNGETIRIRGQVQGVGFRPFVWRLARAMGIGGTVRNDAEGVLIHAAHRDAAVLEAFALALRNEAPPLARIDALERAPIEGVAVGTFQIVETVAGAVRTRVTPDAIVCGACLAEVFDTTERRHGYPFANCTHCGPRFSILEAVPYDRASTTMRHFPMCADCRAEYTDPADRRFHAQPIACPVCGPKAWLEPEEPGDPIAAAAARLRAGEVVAIKALGGFHLACDACNEDAVGRLRERKRRPAKPFAVMVRDVREARRYASVDEAEASLLASAAAPIVLLPVDGETLAPSVAPGQWAVGLMLPTTPLHALLLAACDGPLVMTSGNLSAEPQVIDNTEARQKLAPFVDAFLMHDRPIARRLDDSVAMVTGGKVSIVRRARGYAPATLKLPEGFAELPPVAAYGGQLKSAICLTRDGEALLSHHLGDLDDLLTAQEFTKADGDYAALFEHRPAVIACDLHPDYRASLHAEAIATREGLPLERVQHHHAHVAALMAEAGWPRDGGPVLGIALDGLGLGPDGTVWGGELLLCDYTDFVRAGHLKAVPLPGGEAAQREPWRNLLAQLDAAGLSDAADQCLADRPRATLRAAMRRGFNSPLTSSAGRLFDAVAAAVGLAPDRQSFEGEAAMRLETAARRGKGAPYAFALCGGGGDPLIIDPSPMWQALLEDLDALVPAEDVAARFHHGLAQALAAAAQQLMTATDAGAVALTGGVMQNRTLLEALRHRLTAATVLTHHEAPPNDGGLALGQAVIAAARHAR